MIFWRDNRGNNPFAAIGVVTPLHAKVYAPTPIVEGEIAAVGRTVDVRQCGHRQVRLHAVIAAEDCCADIRTETIG